MDGNNCEIVGRSNDTDVPGEEGKFVKFVIGNILEIIALPRVAPQ